MSVEAKNRKGDSFELHIKAQAPPTPTARPGKVDDDYLKSSFFLDCDNKGLKTLADQIVGTEAEPWRKARKSSTGCTTICRSTPQWSSSRPARSPSIAKGIVGSTGC